MLVAVIVIAVIGIIPVIIRKETPKNLSCITSKQ